MKKIVYFFVVLLLLIESGLLLISIFVDFETQDEEKESFFLDVDPAWADTLIKRMSIEEKIGQIFFLELENVSIDKQIETDSLIKHFSLGGIRFKNSNIVAQVIMTNYIQSRASIPLMIGSEGSLVNSEDYNLPIGSIITAPNDTAFTGLYLDHFSQVIESAGIHIEFSNTLDRNDTINTFTGFSDSLELSIMTSVKLRKKLYRRNIISCLNFEDDLLFNPNPALIDSLSKLKQNLNIAGYFALQQSPKITLSILSNKLKYHFGNFHSNYYQFKGLIFSTLPDTISEEGLVKLFKSGTDVFIAKSGHEKYISSIKNLVDNNSIRLEDIERKLKKLLLAKKWCGLDKPSFRSAEIVLSKIFSPVNRLLSWKLYEKSVCLIKNEGNFLPFTRLLNHQSHIFVYGSSDLTELHQYMNNYMDIGITYYHSGKSHIKQLSYYKTIILAINSTKNIAEDTTFLNPIKDLAKTKKIILINFGKPQNLKEFEFAHSILQTYDAHPLSQIIVAQTIAGSISPNPEYRPKPAAFSKKPLFKKISRLRYTIPEAAGFVSLKLNAIDSLMEDLIRMGAMPGCQILAAKNGSVFYHKSFGHHTYGKGQPVKNSDLYDIASITKVAATTMAAMKLYQMGKIDLTDSIKYYLDDTINCLIKNHQLRDFFIHQTGLPPDMPILQYIKYRKPGIGRFDSYFRERKDSLFSIKVADKFFLRKDYLDSIRLSLYNLEWDSTKAYCYSDINFNIIYDALLKRIRGNYSDFLNSGIYRPLQLRTIGYLPLNRFPEQRITPTQDDRHWRKQLLKGFPHDESAAIYGGVSGNAGLFSNANDLAILFQMLLNGGTYGGQKIFEKEVVDYFTSPQADSERGLGFSLKDGFFGHTGFTGCVVWANPKTQMIYILLSNSIHPRPTNQKFKQMQIRNRVLEMILASYKPVDLVTIE